MKHPAFSFLVFLLLVLTQGASAQDVRGKSMTRLKALGFKVSPSLPTDRPQVRQLRPLSDIKNRLTALQVLVLWVVAPADQDASPLRQRALEGDLKDWLTEDEKAIFRLEQPEAQALHIDKIGWKMENLWALAWVLGFQSEPALEGQLQGPLARELVFEFCRSKTEKRLRPLEQIVELEDLFYCAHNAVRSAQNGGQTVPAGYDPLADGGGVHERRHGLTWCLSPGVEWDDTDLST